MTLDLFPSLDPSRHEAIGPAAFVLHAFAHPYADALRAAIRLAETHAPFRNMVTPGGFTMSVAMTNCGHLGWTTDRRGYRYTEVDPETSQPWPPMPAAFQSLAHEAAAAAGFDNFTPDACLINRYLPGTRLTLHQDKNEKDYTAPIVSVSLGMPAVFLWGGHKRSDGARRIPLTHGDVVVWGDEDRLRYHGVAPLKEVPHPLMGAERINLTFRKAG